MNIENFVNIVKPNTMTSVERIKHLYSCLEYLREKKLEDDIVECGVWKGGNVHGILEYLTFYSMKNAVWLYDTFSGMTAAAAVDVDYQGNHGGVWNGKCNSNLEEVKSLINEKKYPNNPINYVVGDICETLNSQNNIPQRISLLRLDTDWYLSTKKELEVLFPILNNDGVLIIDDYGHWQGSKKATQEYFGDKVSYLKEIDYTAVCLFKNQL